MIPPPKWATVRLKKFSCSLCGRQHTHMDIVATGIRAGLNGCGVFFLEPVCGHCRSPSVCMFAVGKLKWDLGSRNGTPKA